MSFGTSPVKDAYWVESTPEGAVFTPMQAEYGSEYQIKLRPCTMGNLAPGDTVVIKSVHKDILQNYDYPGYQMVYVPVPDVYDDLSLYAKAYLGILQTIGYRFSRAKAILNDSWVVNLRTPDMNNAQKLSEELKKRWEGKEGHPMYSVDLTTEMKDLLKTYESASVIRGRQAKDALDDMYRATKEWIECHEAKMAEDTKLEEFRKKMKAMEISPDEKPKGCCMGDK